MVVAAREVVVLGFREASIRNGWVGPCRPRIHILDTSRLLSLLRMFCTIDGNFPFGNRCVLQRQFFDSLIYTLSIQPQSKPEMDEEIVTYKAHPRWRRLWTVPYPVTH